jgi:hypothetical protein
MLQQLQQLQHELKDQQQLQSKLGKPETCTAPLPAADDSSTAVGVTNSSEHSMLASLPAASVLHGVAAQLALLKAQGSNAGGSAVVAAAFTDGPDGWVANLAAITARAAAVRNCTVLESAAAAAAYEDVAAAWREHCTPLAALLERNLRSAALPGGSTETSAASAAGGTQGVSQHRQEAAQFAVLALSCLSTAVSSSQPGGPEQQQLYSLITSRIKLLQQDQLHSGEYSKLACNTDAGLKLVYATLVELQGCLQAAAGSSTAAVDVAALKLRAGQLPAAAVPWLALVLRCFTLLGQMLHSPLAAAAAADSAGQQVLAGGSPGRQVAAVAGADASAAAAAAAAGLHCTVPYLEQQVVYEDVLNKYQVPVPAALHLLCSTSENLLCQAQNMADILQKYIECCAAAEPGTAAAQCAAAESTATAAVELHALLAATLSLCGSSEAAIAATSAGAAAPPAAAGKHSERRHAGTTSAVGKASTTEATSVEAAATAPSTSSAHLAAAAAANSDALNYDVQLLLDALQQLLLPGLAVLADRCQQYMAERDVIQEAEQERLDRCNQQCEEPTPAGGLISLDKQRAADKAPAADLAAAAAAGFVEAQHCQATDALRAIGVLCSQDNMLHLLPDELQWLESDFAARLPNGWCCNNLASCSNLQGGSELQLVARHSCICAGCGEDCPHAARYCSRQCKEQH